MNMIDQLPEPIDSDENDYDTASNISYEKDLEKDF